MRTIYGIISIIVLCLSLKGNGPPAGPSNIISLSNRAKLNIYTGWNLLSSPVNSGFNTKSIKNVVNNELYFFDTKTQEWKNGMGISIRPGIGFWVNVSGKQEMEYVLKPNNQFQINDFEVVLGWNLLGMSAETERVSAISSKLIEKYQNKKYRINGIYIYDAKISSWKKHSPYYQGSLKGGMGFWIEVVK